MHICIREMVHQISSNVINHRLYFDARQGYLDHKFKVAKATVSLIYVLPSINRDLRYNAITVLPESVFANLKNLERL